MSKVSAIYHIVFCTKHRKMTLPLDLLEDVYKFIWSILQSHNCKLYLIGGISNHIHMLIELHPMVALAPLVQEIKAKSSGFLRSDKRFRHYEGWAVGYYAATVANNNREPIIAYIKNQREHHLVNNFDD